MSAVLEQISQALAELAEQVITGVVAVRAGAYRVVSGVAIRPDLIAVADHGLKRRDRVPVHAVGGREGTAVLLGRDQSVDVAILKVEGFELQPLKAANPDELRAGMLITVAGLTIDAGPSISVGLLGAVSGPRRTFKSGTLDRFLRLDVNLYPSQTGAAVVTAQGDLIGMATPGLLRHSAVAVPITNLNKLADELLKQGRLRQGYIGVALQPVAIPEWSQQKLGGQFDAGLIVLSVEPNSPADAAGLHLGDILVSLDEKPLRDMDDLQQALRAESVGSTLDLVLLRGGEAFRRQITVGERASKRDA